MLLIAKVFLPFVLPTIISIKLCIVDNNLLNSFSLVKLNVVVGLLLLVRKGKVLNMQYEYYFFLLICYSLKFYAGIIVNIMRGSYVINIEIR